MTARHPLAVVGNVNVDLILGPVAPWPTPGTEVLTAEHELRPGGAAGNASDAWAELGIFHQIAANTGSGPLGAWLAQAYVPRSDRWPVAREEATISVGITHPDGERTFFTTKGHLSCIDWPTVEAMLDWPALAGGTLLACGSFITEALAAEYDALFAKARHHGIGVALDTGWPPCGWDDRLRARVAGWAEQSACLLMNAAEAAAQTGCTDPGRAAVALQSAMAPGGIAVVKCGPDGAVAAGPAGEGAAAPAPQVEVIDTIGAGDVFNAAFLAARAAGSPLAACLTEGTRIASAAVSTRPRRLPPLLAAPIEEPTDDRA